jgi:hypothetical protein
MDEDRDFPVARPHGIISPSNQHVASAIDVEQY